MSINKNKSLGFAVFILIPWIILYLIKLKTVVCSYLSFALVIAVIFSSLALRSSMHIKRIQSNQKEKVIGILSLILSIVTLIIFAGLLLFYLIARNSFLF